MTNRLIKKDLLIAFGIPTLYTLTLRLFFGLENWNDLFVVMSVTFLFLLPTILGALTIFFSSPEKVKNNTYVVFAPWIPVFLFLLITLFLAIEGWACWIMILPIFLITASLGGIFGKYYKKRISDSKMSISLIMFLPLLLAPLESLINTLPATYEARTYIDISAPDSVIWDNVTRVNEISLDQDKGYLTRFLGLPRPVKAELDFEGVGAYREAIFTNGLIFHETVTEYEDNKKMVFRITANPHEIPSTTLDEHVVIGGTFFDVLNGTYELEKLPNGQNRLHLYSQFKMNTNFNFYAGWWGKLIMNDIQDNILQIEKQRSESN